MGLFVSKLRWGFDNLDSLLLPDSNPQSMADCLECILSGLDCDCECEYCDFEVCNDWFDTLADCDAGDCVDCCTCSGSCYDLMAKPESAPAEGYASITSGGTTASGPVPVVPVVVNFTLPSSQAPPQGAGI